MKKKKIILCIIIFIFVLITFKTMSMASSIIDPDEYKTTVSTGDASYIFNKGATIIATLRNISAIVAVFAITIIGIRYVLGSVEERAEYKKTMGPVVLACILIASLAQILKVIASLAS